MPVSVENNDQQPPSDFLIALKIPGNFYIGLQSVLDALDLWISSVKYYFDAINPASNSASSQMFWSWLHSEEGMCLFFMGAAFSAAFAFMGNGIPEKYKSNFSMIADMYWPFVRDVIKRLKWTFKGTRSLLLVTQTLLQQNYISYITPFGIALGLLGASNQFWNRGMVESRKILQEYNDRFRQQIKGIDACFLEVEKDWIYNGDDVRENVKYIYAGSILKIKSTQEYYRVDAFGGITAFDPDQLNPNEQIFFRKLERKLEELRLPQNGGSSYPRITWNEFQELIPPGTDLQENSILQKVFVEKKEFIESHIVQSQSNINQILFNQARFQGNSNKAFVSATLNGLLNAPYYFLGVLSMVTLPAYLFVPAVAICGFFMMLNILSEIYQESDYQRRLKISQLKANLVMNKRLLMMEWQVLNADYPDSLKNELELLARSLKEEREFQVLVKKIQDTQGLSRFEKYQLDDLKSLSFANIPEYIQNKTLLNALIRIENLERGFIKNHNELDSCLCLNPLYVSWQAIRNGLVVYGAFNSLLMTIATMSFLFGLTITPTFFYVSISVGSLMLLATFLYTLFFIQPKQDIEEEMGVHIDAEPSIAYVAKSTQVIIDSPVIQASENLLIPEHAEVFRQALSGAKKGIKCTQTILPLLVRMSEDLNPVLLMTYLTVSAGYGFLFALKGLRGLIRLDSNVYEKSFMYATITGKSPFFEPAMSANKKSIRDFISLGLVRRTSEDSGTPSSRSSSVAPSPLSIGND